jgi:hypothetical protein
MRIAYLLLIVCAISADSSRAQTPRAAAEPGSSSRSRSKHLQARPSCTTWKGAARRASRTGERRVIAG